MQIRFHKIDEFFRIYDETRCLILFGSENMILFTTELYILSAQKAASHIYFLTIFQKLKLILMILYLEKRIAFTKCYNIH